MTQTSTTLYAGLITRNWLGGASGKTQWNDIILSNPNNSQVAVTIKVYSARDGAGKTQGQLLKTITKNIPAYGWFNTYGDNDWNLPDNYDPEGTQTLAWAEITTCPSSFQGDADCDGNINDYDYRIWQCEYIGNGSCSNPTSNKNADFNNDNKVDLINFEIWRNYYYSNPMNL